MDIMEEIQHGLTGGPTTSGLPPQQAVLPQSLRQRVIQWGYTSLGMATQESKELQLCYGTPFGGPLFSRV